MTDDPTARLALPLLQPGQAQKEMYHNEALARLDLAVQACVASAGAETPPADPEPGECWILGSAPTGAWTGHPGEIAGWTPGGWRFLAPREGMRAWVADVHEFALFSDEEWVVGRSHGALLVEGVQVVGPQGEAITAPTGGATVDAEARSAISAILAAMREHGLIAPPDL